MSSSIIKLQDSELLDLIKDQVTISETHVSQNDVLLFISNYSLETGSKEIPITLLYELYLNWTNKPLVKKEFISRVSTFIKVKDDSVFINESLMAISKSLLLLLKNKKANSETNQRTFKRHLDIFFKHYGISKGTSNIEFEHVWSLYSNWLRVTYRKKGYRKEQFYNLLSLFLKAVVTKNKMYFKLSENTSEILIKENIINEKKEIPKEQY